VDKTASPAARKIAALLRTADPATKKRILQQLVSLPANSSKLPKQLQRAHEVNTKKLLSEPLSLLDRIRASKRLRNSAQTALGTPDTLQDLSEAGIDTLLRNRVALENPAVALKRIPLPQRSTVDLAEDAFDRIIFSRDDKFRAKFSTRLSDILNTHKDPRREIYTLPLGTETLDGSKAPKGLLSPKISSWKGTTQNEETLNPVTTINGFYSGYGPVAIDYARNPFTLERTGIVWRAKRKLLDSQVRDRSIYTPHVMRVDPEERRTVGRRVFRAGAWDTLPEYETVYENVPAKALHPYIAISEPDGKVLYGVKRPRELMQRIFDLFTQYTKDGNTREDRVRTSVARYYGVNPADLPS